MYGDCGRSQVKCCNCGWPHAAAHDRCTVRKQAAEIQQVGTEERISYAEALRRVNNKGRKPDEEQGIGDGRGMEEKGRNQPEVQMDKHVLFLAQVKTEKIKIVVKAAAKFFKVKICLGEKYIEILVMENVHQTHKL